MMEIDNSAPPFLPTSIPLTYHAPLLPVVMDRHRGHLRPTSAPPMPPAVMEIDTVGTFTMCKSAFGPLSKSPAPCIINISATLQYGVWVGG